MKLNLSMKKSNYTAKKFLTWLAMALLPISRIMGLNSIHIRAHFTEIRHLQEASKE
jgi:hypothetical protein